MDSSELPVNDIVIPVFLVSSYYISVEARKEIFAQYWVMLVINVSVSQLPFLPAFTEFQF